MAPKPKFLTSTGASLATGISLPTITKWCNLGVVTPIRDSGNRRLFTEAEVEKLRAYRAERVEFEKSRRRQRAR